MATITTLPPKNQVIPAEGASFAQYKQEVTSQRRNVFLKENMLLFVLQGSKTLYFNNTTVSGEPGTLLFFKKGLYVMSEFIPEGASFRALVIYCRDNFLKEFSLEHFPQQQSEPSNCEKLFLSIPYDPLIQSFNEQFLGYFDNRHLSGLDKILHLKLQELFLLLMSGNHREEVKDWIQSIVSGQTTDVDYIVRTYLFEPFTLTELAKLSGKSLAAFKRDFQNRHNTSPKKWMNTQRLIHSKTLLTNTELNISEIAARCGYENVPYFTRAFRHEFDETPTSWRSKSARD